MMFTSPAVGLSFPVKTTLMCCGSTEGSHFTKAYKKNIYNFVDGTSKF